MYLSEGRKTFRPCFEMKIDPYPAAQFPLAAPRFDEHSDDV